MQPWRELPARWLGSAVMALEAAAGLGLLSGAAVALFIGKFMLAGWLALALLGIVLRFTRRRARDREAAGKPLAPRTPS